MAFGRRLGNRVIPDGESDQDNGRPCPRSTKHSRRRDELSNDNSRLAQFLIIGADGWESRQRRDTSDSDHARSTHEHNDDDGMPRMGTLTHVLFSLGLEPTHIRNERVIQLFEAYAIFGALFVNCAWILYEWGSDEDDNNPIVPVRRLFEFTIAVSLSCSLLMALLSACLWISSILWSSSHEDFVLESAEACIFLFTLLQIITASTAVGLFLGTITNLSPRWPELVVALAVEITVFLLGIKMLLHHNLAVVPLEFYHSPSCYTICMSQQELKSRAQRRAQELRKRAYRARKKFDTNFPARSSTASNSSVSGILKKAALNLGRNNDDISTYAHRLEEEWFEECDQLHGMSVECLSKYMPLRLAREVSRILSRAE